MSRNPIDMDLSDFETEPRRAPDPEAVKAASTFPSREPAPPTSPATPEAKITIRLPADVAQRFYALAKSQRYTHGGLVEMLLNAYEKGEGA